VSSASQGSSAAAGGRFLAGDGLRALAALSVLGFHVTALANTHHGGGPELVAVYGHVGGPALQALNTGVYVFFVLSGYLLGRPFVRAIVQARPFPSLQRYSSSRLLRLVPAFWLAVTATLLIGGTRGSSGGEILAVYGFAQVYDFSGFAFYIGQAWTLDIEIVFYFVLPVGMLGCLWLVRRLSRPSRVAVLITLVTAAGLGSLALDLRAQPDPMVTKPWHLLFAFVPGLWLAAVESVLADRVRGRRVRLPVAGLIAAAACLYVVYCTTDRSGVAQRSAIAVTMAGSLVAAALLSEWSTGRGWRVFTNPVMSWIGERSYGIYLFHVLVLTQLAKALPKPISTPTEVVVLLPATALVSLAAAAISWRFLERPLLARKPRPTASAVVEPAPA
jgi:peptidoglycan/LPS O-acetylase OafA/YrhL